MNAHIFISISLTFKYFILYFDTCAWVFFHEHAFHYIILMLYENVTQRHSSRNEGTDQSIENEIIKVCDKRTRSKLF